MREALIALVAVSIVAVLEATYNGLRYLSERRTRDLQRRLQAIGTAVALDAKLLRRGRLAASPALVAFLRAIPTAERLERLLEQADSRLTVAQLLASSALASIVGAIVGAIVGRAAPLALLMAVMSGAVPFLAILGARARRSGKLSEQLPEALDMMARSLRAGHALPGAFQLVATEMAPPIGIEFARAFEEQKLGVPLERAVQAMSARAPANGDLKIFAVSAVIQRETGGNLAEILESIASTIRERYRFYGKLKALTAEGRASGLVLGLLPIAMALVIAVLNPKYLVRLVDNPQGHMILVVAAVAWALGLIWMYRLTKLEV